MYHFSKNIGKLQRLFTFPISFRDTSYQADFEKSLKFKILAILLAKAELATPELNRETVKALLEGKINWPKIDGSNGGISTDIDIEVFEKLGVLSFYADYCSVHASSVRDEKILNDSIKPLYEAIKTIKNIIYGIDFIKPHFEIDKGYAESLLKENSLIIDLDDLPELVCRGDRFQIDFGNSNLNSLFAEYLWVEFTTLNGENQKYNEIESDDDKELTEDEKLEFKKWLLITRVYSDSYLWDINLESIDDSKKRLFLLQIKNLIEEDAQLKKPQCILDNQWQNDRHFEQILVQVNQSINISINSSAKSETKINDGEPISFTLDQIKTRFIQENNNQCVSHLSFARNWRICKERKYPVSGFGGFYGATGKIAEADIYIDSQAIYSYGNLDSLFSLSDERPELRHILLNVLPWKNGIDYWLYLLSKIETTTTAIYIFTYDYHLLDNSLVNETPDSLHHVYFPLVCDEFLDVSFKNKHNLLPISDITELLIFLAKDCIDETFNGGARVDKDCLDMLLIRFSLDQVSYFAKTLLSGIADDETHRINSLPVWKFYLLFWLLEKCQDFGLFSKINMEDDIQASISTTYINAFNSNIDNENYSFNANEIFDHLPWWRVNDKCLTEFLDIIQKPAKWGVKLDNTSLVGHHNKDLTRSYFQLMLCLYSKGRSDEINNKLIKKITGLLESCGFSVEADKHLGLFDYESNHDYSLWKKLTLQIDTINDESFDRIIDVLKSDAPINRILEIYSQTNKEFRKTMLLEQIGAISKNSFDELGIGMIEESLNFACGAGQLDLANTLLEKGLSIINDKESFLQKTQDSCYFSILKNKWASYEFKIELLKIINDNSLPSNERVESLIKLKNPFNRSNHDPLKDLFKSCDYFRRFMVAMAYYESDSKIAYQHFDNLYKEDGNIQYSGNRLASKLAYLDTDNGDINDYQHALSEWLESTSDIDIQSIEMVFIQNWLHCLIKIHMHIPVKLNTYSGSS